jgi:hypothetical protein
MLILQKKFIKIHKCTYETTLLYKINYKFHTLNVEKLFF